MIIIARALSDTQINFQHKEKHSTSTVITTYKYIYIHIYEYMNGIKTHFTKLIYRHAYMRMEHTYIHKFIHTLM